MTTQQALREGFIDYLTAPRNQVRSQLRAPLKDAERYAVGPYHPHGGACMCIQGHMLDYWNSVQPEPFGYWFEATAVSNPYVMFSRHNPEPETKNHWDTGMPAFVADAYGLIDNQAERLMRHNDSDKWTLTQFIPLLCGWWSIPLPPSYEAPK